MPDVGIELGAACMPSELASDRATVPGLSNPCYRYIKNNVMILSFRTDMPRQTVQTQIRLLLEEQFDQGLHCLPFCLHRLDTLLYGIATEFKF